MDAEPESPGRTIAYVALAVVPLNFAVWIWALTSKGDKQLGLLLFTALALLQLVCGIVAIVRGRRAKRAGLGGTALTIGIVTTATAPVGWILGVGGWFLTLIGSGLGGGAWGRPLRVRGRQIHPELREGADWTQGDRPDPSGLDPATRRALEALWLHDAQKEHASVPAFSRISWLLAAVGAPAELMAWAHRAAIEEIEHTRLCFALAAGYAGRSQTVEPMPELLVGGLGLRGGDALVTLAVESLGDGCQLEDFNADVAAECALACDEPVTRAVLERIAREERSHAELSWALVAWLLERDRARVQPALEGALARLGRYRRPTAVSSEKAPLVALADAAALRAHGRLPDERWGALWQARLQRTADRLGRLFASPARKAA